MSYTKPNKIVTNPLDAIKEMCIDCCGGERSWVKDCNANDCPLHEFRLGKNPYRKSREYTDEQKEELKERAKLARESKKS